MLIKVIFGNSAKVIHNRTICWIKGMEIKIYQFIGIWTIIIGLIAIKWNLMSKYYVNWN